MHACSTVSHPARLLHVADMTSTRQKAVWFWGQNGDGQTRGGAVRRSDATRSELVIYPQSASLYITVRDKKVASSKSSHYHSST